MRLKRSGIYQANGTNPVCLQPTRIALRHSRRPYPRDRRLPQQPFRAKSASPLAVAQSRQKLQRADPKVSSSSRFPSAHVSSLGFLSDGRSMRDDAIQCHRGIHTTDFAAPQELADNYPHSAHNGSMNHNRSLCCSVNYAPGSICQVCPRSVPPVCTPPPPVEISFSRLAMLLTFI